MIGIFLNLILSSGLDMIASTKKFSNQFDSIQFKQIKNI